MMFIRYLGIGLRNLVKMRKRQALLIQVRQIQEDGMIIGEVNLNKR
ncbi:hypothetical protein HDE70_004244 [Pedobacter cryoconitis]|nr:hypothetical protein [Pedobacter cryoconitis]